MGQQRGCVTDKGRMSVEIALVIVAAIAVVFVVAETPAGLRSAAANSWPLVPCRLTLLVR